MAALAYAASTPALERLVGSAENDPVSRVESALEAGAAEIDEAFASAGYTVPVDLASITDTTLRARWTDRLAQVNRDLAAQELAVGQVSRARRGQPATIKEKARAARQFLDRVRKGETKLPGLAVAAASETFGAIGLHVSQRTNDALDDAGLVSDVHDASYADR